MNVKKMSMSLAILTAVVVIALYFQTNNNVDETSMKTNESIPPTVENIQIVSSKDKLKNNIALTPDDEYSWRDLGNGTINTYALETSTLGLASIYPKSPLELYLNNIEKAELGDAKSQYFVARAIRECQGAAKESQIQELASENLDENMMKIIKAQSSYCKDIIEALPSININNWNSHYEWLVEAKENGNADAMAWYMNLHPDQFNQEQALDILSNAFNSGESDDFFVYSNALTYISSYVPDSDILRESWKLAICKVRSMCDQSVMKAYSNYLEIRQC